MAAVQAPIPPGVVPGGVMHSAMPDWLSMPTDRFLLILERLERRQKPHGEWCLVALSLCLACLFPLVTTETFKSTFGFKPEMWEAFSLLGTLVFGLVAVGLFARWAYLKVKRPKPAHEQILRDVIDEMAQEEHRAATRAAAAAPVSPASVAGATGPSRPTT